MSPNTTARSFWNAPTLLLLLLAISLLGWRLSTRLGQYHPSIATRTAVTFFDANERNIAYIAETRSHSPVDAPEETRLFRVVILAPPLPPAHRHRQDDPPPIARRLVEPVQLFSNPPPSLS